VTGPLGMWLGIAALRHADASALAPWTYTRLIASLAIGAVAFGEPVTAASAVGAAVIVTACLLAAR
jgi:drug/metabolite transporter (DMT)-like permease